jgi:hypothetical protein
MGKKRKHSHADHHRAEGLMRRQKNLIHFSVIAIIAALLLVEGAKTADFAFLALSIITEVA